MMVPPLVPDAYPTRAPLRHAIPSPESAAIATASTAAPSSIDTSASRMTLLPLPLSTSTSTTTVTIRSATSTNTVSTTVLVSLSPSTTLVEDAQPSSDTSSVVVGAVQSAAPDPISPMAQLGMSFGITFGVLAVAGVAGIYLWRRRRYRRGADQSENDKQKYRTMLSKVLTFRRSKDNKDDPEWSIESAEKVAIVGNMRAQSVSTSSRSDSRGSDGSNTIGIIPIAMPQRKMTIALTSHPPTPNRSAFPKSPSDVQPNNALEKEYGPKEKPKSWALRE